MTEVIGIVEQGRIKLPDSIRLAEGLSVRVLLDGIGSLDKPLSPLEEEEWTEEEMRWEVAEAAGKPFSE